MAEDGAGGSNGGLAALKTRILILDDEVRVLEVLGQYLTDKGYECVTTTSPVEALERLRSESFSLALTDLKMPEMDGVEFVKRAKEQDPDLMVVVVTALIEVSKAVDAVRAGADDYILKPFNLTEIVASVSRALNKRSGLLDGREYQEQLERRVAQATAELERINKELCDTKQYLENLLHSTVDAIITIDLSGRVEFVNDGGVQMFGYPREEFVGSPWARFCAGGEDEVSYLRRVLREDAPLQNYETHVCRKDGTIVPVNMSVSLVRGADNQVASMLAICKDITKQKRLEMELKEMSIRDSLTGLYNQRYFYDRLKAEIDRARRQGHPLSLLLFDIDAFKAYNDCHGHLAGDKVLQVVGSIILECTRDAVDMGFRYGGDEFTVILPEADEEQAVQVAERIRKSFEAKRFGRLTLSIGLMAYREGFSVRSFIQFTDAMMYEAKRAGGNRVYSRRVAEPAPTPAVQGPGEAT